MLGTESDSIMRDLFIFGLDSQKLRDELLGLSEETLEVVIEKAKTLLENNPATYRQVVTRGSEPQS